MMRAFLFFLLIWTTPFAFGQSCTEMFLKRQSVDPDNGGDSFWCSGASIGKARKGQKSGEGYVLILVNQQ